MNSGRASGWYVPSMTVNSDGNTAVVLSLATIPTALSLSLFSR